MATEASQATTAPSSGQASEVAEYRWLILLGLITAAIMEVLDTTIVNVALPQMAGNLGATFQEIGWVSTGYILSNVVVLPMTAFFTATFGRRNYLIGSIVLFIVASFLCGTSSSLGELVLWRIMQGAGGAALLSTAQATIRQIFPREEQGMVQAIFILGIIVAPTLGPTLGGWITDHYTWNWCFFINVPIGIASAFLVANFPPGSAGHADARFRPTGSGSGCSSSGSDRCSTCWRRDAKRTGSPSMLIMRLTVIAAVTLGDDAVVGAVVAQRPSGRELPRAEESPAGRVDLSLHRARLRPLRRHLHLPAVHAEPARILRRRRPG